MAALCFSLTTYSQEVVKEAVTETTDDYGFGLWDDEYSTIDSLKKLSKDYYKDPNRWKIFIEPSVVVNADTVFDKAGLKHAYYVRRFYFIAVPEKTDFQYQPQVIGPYLYAYGQKMPIEGKDAQHFQMIRKAVFPFAADFPASTPSSAIFQKYIDKNFENDLNYIIDSLMVLVVNSLETYDFEDTTQHKSDTFTEFSRNQTITVLSCLKDEYTKAIPGHTSVETPTREPIASPKSIEHLKKIAVKTQGNIFVLPQNTILNQFAHEPDEEMQYFAARSGEEGVDPILVQMTINKESYETEELEYGEYDGTYDYRLSSISGQSYFMLNENTVLLYPETYYHYESDYIYSFGELEESRNIFGLKNRKPDTILIISPDNIEKMTLADCYQSCLKDTNCTFEHTFPPVLSVYINDELYDWNYYFDCKECYKKETILEYLKEGSVLYDYFAKDFYLNDLPYKDAKSISYSPASYKDNDVIYVDDLDLYESESDTTIYFSKSRSQAIKKLLTRKNKLTIQANKLKLQAITIMLGKQIPKGQLHIKKTYMGSWLLEGENAQKKAPSYDDDSVIISIDDKANTPKEKWEIKLEQLEKKFYDIIDKMDQIDDEIEKITGHSITLDEDYYE